MGRLFLVGAMVVAAGCEGGPCASFAGQTCVALRVLGPGIGEVDQIEVESRSGFTLESSRTPPMAGARFALPVVVPIALKDFSGELRVGVRALLGGSEVAFGNASARLAPLEHRAVEVQLIASCPPGARPVGGECLDWEEEPSGLTTRLSGVWGSAANDVYVVGDEGRVLRSTGDGTWSLFHDHGSVGLQAVGGTGADDVLVARATGIHRWNGSAWSQTFFGMPQFAISQSGRGEDVFSVGYWSAYRREGPDSWVSKSAFPVFATWYGVRAFVSAVFVVGSSGGEGMIFSSFDRGDTWTSVAEGLPGLNGLWGGKVDDLWACGYQGTVLHRSDQWRAEPTGTSVKLNSVTGNLEGVFVVGEAGTILFSTRDGKWTPQRSGTTVELTSVWAAGADVWAVGAGGLILRKTK